MIATVLRQAAPELDGQPSFSAFTEGALKLHAIGPENAGRILMLESVGLKPSVKEQLQEVCEASQDQPVISEIFPVLRNAHDFADEQSVALQVPAIHAVWSELPVEYVVLGDSERETATINDGHLVLQDGGSFAYQVAPDWPALLRTGFYRALQVRKSEGRTNDNRLITSFGRIFFESCFYSPKFYLDTEYRDSAYRSLRNFKFKTPVRPKD